MYQRSHMDCKSWEEEEEYVIVYYLVSKIIIC